MTVFSKTVLFSLGLITFFTAIPVAASEGKWSLGKRNDAILNIANIPRPSDDPEMQKKAILSLGLGLESRWEYQRSAFMKAILSVALSTHNYGVHQKAIETLSIMLKHFNLDTRGEAADAITQVGLHTSSPQTKTLAVAKLIGTAAKVHFQKAIAGADKVTESLRNTPLQRAPRSSTTH